MKILSTKQKGYPLNGSRYLQMSKTGVNIQNIQRTHIIQYQKKKKKKETTTQWKYRQGIWIDISPKKTYKWPSDTGKKCKNAQQN